MDLILTFSGDAHFEVGLPLLDLTDYTLTLVLNLIIIILFYLNLQAFEVAGVTRAMDVRTEMLSSISGHFF